jgi:histone acetyltransferase (RNA polymerase elongator complex component)
MKPLIIPVFLSHLDCPHACVYCSRDATAAGGPALSFLRDFLGESIKRLPPASCSRERQVAFYGATFTAMSPDAQVAHLLTVRPFLDAGVIHSIRVSTRPDALDEDRLFLLRKHGVKTVEIGVQSMNDEVLALSNRRHRAMDSILALSRLKAWGFEAGVHLMIGLPGDSIEHFLRTLDLLIPLGPDFVRIHPTLVLKGAPLEELWRGGRYTPLTEDEAVQWLKRAVLKLEKASIPIARIGLQATRELDQHLLAGPFSPSLNQRVRSGIALEMAAQLLGGLPKQAEAVFFCHPKEVSNIRGQRSDNVTRLKERFGIDEFILRTRDELPRECLVLRTAEGERTLYRKDLP